MNSRAHKHAAPAVKPRLVLVDDEPQVLEALTDQLEDRFTVQAARSGEEALNLLNVVTDVSVLLSDQRMPGMTGDELFARVTTRSDASRVLITGFADIEAVMLAVNKGQIFGYVAKPWQPDDLLAVLLKAYQHHQLVRELKRERELLRNLMQNVPDEIYFKSLDHRFIRINHAAARAQGIETPELAEGKIDADFASDDDLIGAVHREDATVVESARPLMVDELRRLADGAQCWVSKIKAPVLDEYGKVTSLVTIARDITERKRVEQALQSSERIKAAILEASLDCFILMDHGGIVREFNPAAESTFGYRRSDVLGRPLVDLIVPPGLRDAHRAGLTQYLATGTGAMLGQRQQVLGLRANGAEFPVELAIVAVGDPALPMFAGFARDVSEEVAQSRRIERLTRMHATLSGISSAIVRVKSRADLFREAERVVVETGKFLYLHIWIVDVRQRVLVRENGAERDSTVTQRLPLDGEESTAKRPPCVECFLGNSMVVANDVMPDTSQSPSSPFDGAQGCRSQVYLPLQLDGGCAGVLSIGSGDADFFDDEELDLLQELTGNIAFAMDTLQRRDQLYHLATHDPVTGLLNRARFVASVADLVSPARGSGVEFAILVVNLRRFRHVNESFSRTSGDELLRQAAARLSGYFGASCVAHFGAGLFGVLLVDAHSSRDAVRAGAKARELLGQTYTLDSRQLHVDSRIGVARHPSDGTSAEELCANAEAALQEARGAGNPVVFYQSALNAGVAEQLEMEHRLRTALERKQFVLHYQPKVDSITGQIVAAEALIRWQDPDHGLIPPGRFIPLLEDSGLIVEVGDWALEEAARMGQRLQTDGLGCPRIAVNISQVQMRRPDFPREAIDAVVRGGSHPRHIDLEITESLFTENVDEAVRQLTLLREAGFRIAVDDFGTGYSSLSYLAKLPIDALKIDRSFVINMTEDANAMALVSTIINLARAFELAVIAEGVDSEEQLRILRLLRCEQIQGFLFHKPMAEENFAALLLGEGGIAHE